MIFENAINHWPAMSQWTNDDYLCECMEGHDITLAVVPDGFADAVKPLSQTDPSLVFTLPYEDKMPFQQAMKCVKSSQRGQRVYYCQFQNNGMCDEFKPLLKEVDRDIPWATEALGYGPDAVNFWMGVEDSKTSVHKGMNNDYVCTTTYI
jgi:jumonji domain-containing protein 7